MVLNNAKVKNFRAKVYKALEQELAIREEIKRLYSVLVAEAGNDEMAVRQVRQVYYQIQKHRVTKLLAERLEFHPFFTLQPFNAGGEFMEEDEEDGDDLL